MSNRQMEERVEQRHVETVAAELGITVEELEQLRYREELVTSDEGCPYFYLIEFGDECPQEILDKIEGQEDGRSIQLGVNVFDEEEPEERCAPPGGAANTPRQPNSSLQSVE